MFLISMYLWVTYLSLAVRELGKIIKYVQLLFLYYEFIHINKLHEVLCTEGDIVFQRSLRSDHFFTHLKLNLKC